MKTTKLEQDIINACTNAIEEEFHWFTKNGENDGDVDWAYKMFGLWKKSGERQEALNSVREHMAKFFALARVADEVWEESIRNGEVVPALDEAGNHKLGPAGQPLYRNATT